jgi:A/G-specific adenine glycosylase
MTAEMHVTIKSQVAPRLLAWWDAGHDHFPWRETGDPYAIWVSEVMLQQTQVSTVIPYFERWMARFPTVEALAIAPLDAVLKVWEGLGYYSRARNLHRAAGQLVEEWQAKLPSDPSVLQALPGIGRYTAGAIASIAFGRPVAVLDGNVVRVLARLIDLDADVTRSATKTRLWALAESLVPAERPGDYNQALMELGRKVCRPARPACGCCPLAELCQARAVGRQLDRPIRPPRRRTPHYHVTAGVIWRDDGKLLITQRRLDDMLGGLWEFPGGKQQEGESLADCLRREIWEELGIKIEVGKSLVTVKHAYTHFRITLHAFHCRHRNGTPRAIEVRDFAWVSQNELARYPFAVTDQRIIAALLEKGGDDQG